MTETELRQIIEDAAHHPFGQRFGYGDGSTKYDDCYMCRRPKSDTIHDGAWGQDESVRVPYAVWDLLNHSECLRFLASVLGGGSN